MKRNVQLQALIAVLAAGLMFSSCGNIDIIKRKYRPGFHVDISKKREKVQVAEESGVAEARKTEEMKTVEPVAVKEIESNQELVLTADASDAKPQTFQAEKKESMKEVLHSNEFKGMDFSQRMRAISKEMLKPTKAAPVGGMDWMKWVAFGTGIGSLAFGALALIFAILTVVFFSSFVWGAAVLALLLGAAAITFAILYKKNNGTGSQAKLGMIFGIIGAGLAVLAIILGAVFFAIYVL
ncbi:MAG: hypothetical protein K9G46_01555 [Flavobacteriales bacterium]|jgi:hypothetical protein|nr:hypothetical protein [Flavobacteriales bacterium]